MLSGLTQGSYNLIGFDQVSLDDNGPPHLQPLESIRSYMLTTFNLSSFTNETHICIASSSIPDAKQRCWSYENFTLSASDGKKYHFFEYSGESSSFLCSYG
jgi:hypothetical protein